MVLISKICRPPQLRRRYKALEGRRLSEQTEKRRRPLVCLISIRLREEKNERWIDRPTALSANLASTTSTSLSEVAWLSRVRERSRIPMGHGSTYWLPDDGDRHLGRDADGGHKKATLSLLSSGIVFSFWPSAPASIPPSRRRPSAEAIKMPMTVILRSKNHSSLPSSLWNARSSLPMSGFLQCTHAQEVRRWGLGRASHGS